MTAPAAVLFDLDGTLIDSEDVWNDAYRALAIRRGSPTNDDVLELTRGVHLVEAMILLSEQHGWWPRTPTLDADWVEQQVLKEYRQRIHWRADARRLLASVRAAGIPTALVTSSSRRVVDVILDDLEKGAFTAVVSGDDVAHAKPHPEPYLTAARMLRVDASACLAVEDSPLGSASARAAGCRVLLIGVEAIDAEPEWTRLVPQ